MNYWLLKSEPTCFSINDLAKKSNNTAAWDGVRNYQARNMLRDQFKKGDLAFFYHSSTAEPAIVGIVEVVKAGYPDHTAMDPTNEHFDPKSSPTNPRWYMVDVKLVKKFKSPITLAELRHHPQLSGLILLRKGNRLSITPVTPNHWQSICDIAPQ